MFSFLQSLSAVAFSDFYVQAGPPDFFGSGENVFESTVRNSSNV